MPKPPTLSSLAAQILSHATILDAHLGHEGESHPSFAANAPASWPVEKDTETSQAARLALLELTLSLHDLVLGPTEMIVRDAIASKWTSTALRLIANYGVAGAVPEDKEVALEEVAAKTGLAEGLLEHVLKFAATLGYFRVFMRESDGKVCVEHTAASALLANDAQIAAQVRHTLNTVLPASVKLDEAIQKWGKDGDLSGEPGETAFNEAFGTEKGMWEWFEEEGNEKRRQDFHLSLGFWGGRALEKHVLEAKVWKEVPEGGLVVDVGGSRGHWSFGIAGCNPSLQFLVQDKPEVIETAQSTVPVGFRNRVKFMAHDFFKPQPDGFQADAYLLRWILHDWSDKYSRQILGHLAQAMNPGGRIVIVDLVLPEPGEVPKVKENTMRAIDMTMMTLLNAKERSMEEWRQLIESVDERLGILEVESKKGNSMSVIVVGFKV